MNHRFIFFCGLVVLFSASSVSAQKQRSELKQEQNKLLPIDRIQILRSELLSTQQTRVVKKAYEALQKNQTALALQLSAKIQQTAFLSDYGYWIAAGALRKQAQSFLDKKHYGKALSLAQKSVSELLHIESTNPYSPFIKTLPRELGLSELIWGDALWGIKQWAKAQFPFERAFQRFQTTNQFALIAPSDLSHYAEACKKKRGPIVSVGCKDSSLIIRKSRMN